MAGKERGAIGSNNTFWRIEGAVIAEAIDSIADGKPRLLEFGVNDESAWAVGLACGGRVQIYVERAR